MTGNPQRKYRADYQPPAWLIDDVELDFDIGSAQTHVRATHSVRRNPEGPAAEDWRLDGRDMTLVSVAIDGRRLGESEYTCGDSALVLHGPPEAFTLTVETRIDPEHNLSLEGLYRSGDILCTQCEATGFSRITYFPDRPDVMSRYVTRITADAQAHPVLLSNGDCVETGSAGAGRHYAVFEDPFVKPCYLFALVAGDLGVLRDSHTTPSGRTIDLRLYTEHGNEDQCAHAMASLKQAMVWDEATYGLEYDLDSYAIVAVGSFNMGAMENKSLNVFNTACIFAAPETATDDDFALVRDVVAHEYFHNYTGNRVTCRDWFQLSLKEGLTVHREHQFAIDQGSPGVTRIEQVRAIREVQFPEDAGPRAHPVRPESYVEMNNFYTITVYHKGAELIRMMEAMAGRDAFIAGVRHYLAKHDGQAVTIEDFVVAIEESTGLDLAQFRRWYAQAGTPRVGVQTDYREGALALTLTQSTPATPGQPDKAAFDIPVSVALFDEAGRMVREPEVLRLDTAQAEWCFDGLAGEPTVSALRGFTAPVRLDHAPDDAALARLMAHDSDPVCRWDAAQSLFLKTLVAGVAARSGGEALPEPSERLFEAIAHLLSNPPADRALLAAMLTLPSVARIGEEFDAIDIHAVCAARDHLKQAIATRFLEEFEALRADHAALQAYVFDVEEAGRRRVFRLALDYLAAVDAPGLRECALELSRTADNMTDRMAALEALRDLPGEARDTALAEFAERWADYPLVMDKWLRLQAGTRRADSVEQVTALLDDARFDFTNPNRVRALLGGFARGNPAGFHRADSGGYTLIADQVVRLDALNPQLAAALAGLLTPWRRHAEPEASAMRAALARVGEGVHSDNTREIVEAGLAEAPPSG
ncbi:aminopeptidase N [Salinisphaera orenii MK-B5]|uniref:Aminopeptidase N n=1 Tax=Salinisphaera orenii MK-B5 TaxID=856730 RepID=A0A423PPB9_9GAMM|nr:aminopeptidase N [Salinisphaera orenii]ROO27408.1 aminopeptidase N [Salinisphaera orenii MK-B5]